jgi:MerR family copper efflux transcriptional regulator
VTELPLIACTLDGADQKQRLADWASLLREASRREETAGGYRYSFAAELEPRVRSLTAAEQECCSFLHLELVRTGEELELTVTAPPEAEAAVRFVFS